MDHIFMTLREICTTLGQILVTIQLLKIEKKILIKLNFNKSKNKPKNFSKRHNIIRHNRMLKFLLLSLAASVLATYRSTSYLSQCPSSTGCLNGMRINVTVFELDQCKLKFCYRFRGSRCDLSNFVVEHASFGSAQVSGFVDSYDYGCGPCAYHFCESFTKPIKYDVEQSDNCRNNQYEVCFTTQYKAVGDVRIGLKGGQDCMDCMTKGPVANPNYRQCTYDSQCADQNVCTRDYCSSCGECKHAPIAGCLVTTGTTGLQTSGTTGFQTSGTTGLQTSGTTGLQTSGTTGLQTSGTTGLQTSGTTGFQTSGTTGFQTSGTTGFQTSGTTGFQTSGTTLNPTGITPSDLTTLAVAPPPPAPQCVDVFECASLYNVFVFENFYGDIDIQGRLAAGGDVSFGEHFSAGDQLFPEAGFSIANWNQACVAQYGSYDDCDMCNKCGKSVIVAGNTFHSSPNSRVYFGNWLGSDLSQLKPEDSSYPEYATINTYGAALLDGEDCEGLTDTLDNKFTHIENLLTAYSNSLCQLTPTGFVDFENGETGVCVVCADLPQQVIFIDAADLEAAKLVTIPTITTDSTVIINVQGDNFHLADIDLEGFKGIADHVIWNFCDATTVYIHDVVVWGSILAPHAHIVGGNGAINGHVFAKSFEDSTQVNWVQFHGSTQFNWVPFDACVDLEQYTEPRLVEECQETYYANKAAQTQAAYESGANLIAPFSLLISFVIFNIVL